MGLDLRDRITERLKNLVSAPVPRGNKKAVVLAIASSKGGVGKTTTAVNLSVAFARRGLHTLLIDLDPQAHVAASLRARHPAGVPPLSEVLLGHVREVCEAAFPVPSVSERLFLAGSDKQLAETEMMLSTKIGKELILDGALQATRTRFDAICIDCPPHLGTLTLNALAAADQLLVPSDMSVLALEGVGDILAAVETLRARMDRHLQVAGIVATRFDRRATRTNETIAQSLRDLYGDRLLKTHVPQSSALNRAHLSGEAIFDFAASSPGALAYTELAEELAPMLGLAAHVPATVSARA